MHHNLFSYDNRLSHRVHARPVRLDPLLRIYGDRIVEDFDEEYNCTEQPEWFHTQLEQRDLFICRNQTDHHHCKSAADAIKEVEPPPARATQKESLVQALRYFYRLHQRHYELEREADYAEISHLRVGPQKGALNASREKAINEIRWLKKEAEDFKVAISAEKDGGAAVEVKNFVTRIRVHYSLKRDVVLQPRAVCVAWINKDARVLCDAKDDNEPLNVLAEFGYSDTRTHGRTTEEAQAGLLAFLRQRYKEHERECRIKPIEPFAKFDQECKMMVVKQRRRWEKDEARTTKKPQQRPRELDNALQKAGVDLSNPSNFTFSDTADLLLVTLDENVELFCFVQQECQRSGLSNFPIHASCSHPISSLRPTLIPSSKPESAYTFLCLSILIAQENHYHAALEELQNAYLETHPERTPKGVREALKRARKRVEEKLEVLGEQIERVNGILETGRDEKRSRVAGWWRQLKDRGHILKKRGKRAGEGEAGEKKDAAKAAEEVAAEEEQWLKRLTKDVAKELIVDKDKDKLEVGGSPFVAIIRPVFGAVIAPYTHWTCSDPSQLCKLAQEYRYMPCIGLGDSRGEAIEKLCEAVRERGEGHASVHAHRMAQR